MTLEYLINKYGLRMTANEISQELKIPYKTIMAKRASGQLKFKTYRDGQRIYADCRDVALHIDGMREAA